MRDKWFLNNNEEISGPFSSAEIQERIKDGLSPETLIWGRQQKEWRTLSWWKQALPQLLSALHQGSFDQPKWHIAMHGKSQGPLTRKDLIDQLKDQTQLQGIMIWCKGMKSWLPIFDFHDIMDDLGIDKRRSPRSQITGTVTAHNGLITGIGQIKSISEGGLGVMGLPAGIPGQELHLEITSPHLSEPIRAKAEIRYITETGYFGMQFTQISMEAKSTIIDYIRRKQHSDSHPISIPRAA